MASLDGLGPWFLGQLKSLRPAFMAKKPHFNFISAHYFWIVGMSLLGSVIIFSAGARNTDGSNLAYVDALFFSVGANTQAGLNTVDVSNLNTFQQIVLYFLAMFSNPIIINSFVVFLRLYWFERRFQHIAHEAMFRRVTVSMSKSRPKTMPNPGQIERGLDPCNILVMHDSKKTHMTNDGIVLGDAIQQASFKNSAPDNIVEEYTADEASASSLSAEPQPPRHTEITFAPPPRRTREEHIAIIERQRKVDDEVLRIPGPRDAERGIGPRRLQKDDTDEPEPLAGRRRSASNGLAMTAEVQTGELRQQAITIKEPVRSQSQHAEPNEFHTGARAFKNTFSFLRFGKLRKRPHSSASGERILRLPTLNTIRTVLTRDKDMGTPYLSWEPTLGRNSAFPDLSDKQREELGGIEYRSLKTLALILAWYFWGFSVIGVACLLPWILRVDVYGKIVDDIHQSRTWWGFWTAHSAFTDLGFTLNPDSMNSFNTAVFPLLIMTFLIIVGNTGFPIMLRFIIWAVSLIIPPMSGLYEELRFLLDHPRRCFTLLFPSGATWWLFWLLVLLNGVDLLFFVILDLGSGPINDLAGGVKVLDGLFQAASTRTAGFSCINLANLHPGVQVSYMIMMYISVFPIAISVRRTNVYEERSLGVYGKDDEDDGNMNDLTYVGTHLRRQLSFDLWYIFVGLFILSISEGSRLLNNDFSMFAVLFEIVSAYGTVGMSLGYTNVNTSLCGQFSVVGKLVIIAMMIRGRHRGLPYGLDRAILLPSEALNSAEAHDADARSLARRNSHTSVATGRPVFYPIGQGHRRNRSIDRRNSNILTAMLQPGPPMTPKTVARPSLNRRSTDLGTEDDDQAGDGPFATSALLRRVLTTGHESRRDEA